MCDENRKQYNNNERVYKGEQRSLSKPTPDRNQATPPKPKK